jgi:uncharacterized DUF497 family protein
MILFEWDERKAAANRRKHGISFDNAMEAFSDPGSVSERTALWMVSFAGKQLAWSREQSC